MPPTDTTPDDLDVIFPGLTNVLHQTEWTPSNSNGLVADAEHGGVTDESLAEFVRARMAQGQPLLSPLATTGGGSTSPVAPVVDETPDLSQPDPSEEGPSGEPVEPDAEPVSPSEGAPTPDGEPAPPPPPAAPAPSPDEPTAEQLASWRAFQDAINPLSPNFNPGFRQLVADFYTSGGRLEPTTPPAASVPDLPAAAPAAPAAPPLADEYTDPAVLALQQRLEQLQAQVAAQNAQITAASQSVTARAEADMRAVVESAVTEFKSANALGDDDIRRLRTFASNTRLIDPWMSGINPETGAPLVPDLALATRKALESAMYADPTLRERKIREAMSIDVDRQRKRQRLAGIGGAGGSVGRATAPPPLGTPESKAAMVAEVGAILNGSWTDPG